MPPQVLLSLHGAGLNLGVLRPSTHSISTLGLGCQIWDSSLHLSLSVQFMKWASRGVKVLAPSRHLLKASLQASGSDLIAPFSLIACLILLLSIFLSSCVSDMRLPWGLDDSCEEKGGFFTPKSCLF
jgi:hypothetical protein